MQTTMYRNIIVQTCSVYIDISTFLAPKGYYIKYDIVALNPKTQIWMKKIKSKK